MLTTPFNTFYLRLYGVGHIVKDHSDSKQGFFYMHHPTDRIVHTMANHGALAGMRKSSMGPS